MFVDHVRRLCRKFQEAGLCRSIPVGVGDASSESLRSGRLTPASDPGVVACCWGNANMYRVGMGVALVAACWFLTVPAQAQFSTYPSGLGALACRNQSLVVRRSAGRRRALQPNLVPGPISPQAAPMGPPDCINSLPADHTGAFQCENYVDDCGFFVHIGPMALQRNKLGAGDIAVYNAQAQGQPFGPVIPNPLVPAPPGTAYRPELQQLHAPSVDRHSRHGRLPVGQSERGVDELLYLAERYIHDGARPPGQLDTLFYNPPFTFLGDALFRRADQVSTRFGSSLFSTELNYRRWNAAVNGLELLAGVRYVRQNDLLNITTQGQAQVVNSVGLPVPGPDMAIYDVICHNNIVAPQLGLEYNLPICGWLSLAGSAKGAWGVNYLTTDVSLTRGDGLTAFDTHRNATVFSQIYEIGAFADFHILQKLQLRLGYTSTWITGVATANDQVDFNLHGNAVPLGGDLNQVPCKPSSSFRTATTATTAACCTLARRSSCNSSSEMGSSRYFSRDPKGSASALPFGSRLNLELGSDAPVSVGGRQRPDDLGGQFQGTAITDPFQVHLDLLSFFQRRLDQQADAVGREVEDGQSQVGSDDHRVLDGRRLPCWPWDVDAANGVDPNRRRLVRSCLALRQEHRSRTIAGQTTAGVAAPLVVHRAAFGPLEALTFWRAGSVSDRSSPSGR